MRNPILGMASHDLSNAKTTILGATPGAIPGIDGNPHERFSFGPRIGLSLRARFNYLRVKLPTSTGSPRKCLQGKKAPVRMICFFVLQEIHMDKWAEKDWNNALQQMPVRSSNFPLN